MTGDPLDRECPVCFSRDWEIDYVFTGDDEMRVDTCAVCGWPPPDPQGVKEYRDKWAIAGETPHSHPSPSTLRHAAYLAGRVEALMEVARAARAAADDLLCTSTDSPCADQWGTAEWGRCADPGGEWDLCHGCSAYDALRAALARLK